MAKSELSVDFVFYQSKILTNCRISHNFFQNNSFLGCLRQSAKLKLDGISSIEALKSMRQLTPQGCSEMCSSLMHSMAVYKKTSQTIHYDTGDCVCMESLWDNINQIADVDNPVTCGSQAYVTKWGLSKCTYARFLLPDQTRIPVVSKIVEKI